MKLSATTVTTPLLTSTSVVTLAALSARLGADEGLDHAVDRGVGVMIAAVHQPGEVQTQAESPRPSSPGASARMATEPASISMPSPM